MKWMNSSRVLARTAIVLLAFTAILAPQPLLGQSPGETVFKTKCQVCHGPDGSGNTIMGKKLGAHDLRAEDAQKLTDAQITEIIKKGKDKMKGFEDKLSGAEIKELVAYLRELGKKK